MAVFIEALKASIKGFRRNWRLVPLAVLFDSLFLVLFGFGSSLFRTMANQPLSDMVQQAGKIGPQISSVVGQGGSAFNTLMSDPVIFSSFKSILSAALIFVSLIYLFWTLFNGQSWNLAHKMLNEKHSKKSFMISFAILSLIWTVATTLIFSLIIRFVFYALLRQDPILSSVIIQYLATILDYVLIYFILISISMIPYKSIKENIKRTFISGIINSPTYLISFAIIIAALYINLGVTQLLFQPFVSILPQGVSMAAITIIILRFLIAAPFLTLARMYLIEVSKKVSN